eukprot:scaffold50999_cov31-Prasinocladus_malaysianus.AAC.1
MDMDGNLPGGMYADKKQAASIHTATLKARLPSAGMHTAIRRCQYVEAVEARQYTYGRNQRPL